MWTPNLILLSCLWLPAEDAAAPEPLLLERMENAACGTVLGGVTFSEDVVGFGGLKQPNRWSACLDGEPQSGIDHGPDLRVTSTNFTVEAFVKLAARPRYSAIAAAWDETSNQRSWALVVDSRGGLRFDVSPDGHFHVGNKLETPPRLLDTGAWYHVAAVSEGTTSRLYVNGRQVAEAERRQAGIFPGRARLKLGNVDCYATDGPRPLHGHLDEVRITPAALPPDAFLRTREALPEVHGPVPPQYELPFVATTRAEADQWQRAARARLLQLVAQQEPRRAIDDLKLDLRVESAEHQRGYTLHRASFQGNDRQTRYSCLLAVPDGKGPFPAMLALHGHGGNAEVVFDRSSIYGGFADRFARGGYVVLAPSFPHRPYAALMLWDLFRAVDMLERRPEVDAERIGVAGLSMGGEWTMWLAACDPRVRVAVVSGWMCTTEGVFSVPNCPCWELPGFVELMDVCEVHLLIAPRPVLFESAAHDTCFPIEFSKRGFARIQAGYEVFGARDAVQQDIWPAGHEWHGTLAYPFVDNVLGGRAAAAADTP